MESEREKAREGLKEREKERGGYIIIQSCTPLNSWKRHFWLQPERDLHSLFPLPPSKYTIIQTHKAQYCDYTRYMMYVDDHMGVIPQQWSSLPLVFDCLYCCPACFWGLRAYKLYAHTRTSGYTNMTIMWRHYEWYYRLYMLIILQYVNYLHFAKHTNIFVRTISYTANYAPLALY